MEHLFIHTARDGSVTVAAGSYQDQSDPVTSRGVAVAVRLKPNGALETTFASSGILRLFQKTGNLADVLHDANLGTALVFYNVTSSHEIAIRVFGASGAPLNSFGNQGTSTVSVNGYTWSSGAFDEFGRIVFAVRTPNYLSPQQVKLYQIGPSGNSLNTFGNSGSVVLPIDFNYVFSNVDLTVRRGIIAVASTSSFDSATIRLVAVDYAGKPLTELGPGGFRDYDLSSHGESVEDLQFAVDGSLWLAITDRHEFDSIGKILRLGASNAAPIHNWSSALDVSGEGIISPLDALLVINRLQSPTSPSRSMADTNGDATISPIDALLVINWLNKRGGSGSAEGEQDFRSATFASTAAAADFVLAEFEDLSHLRRIGRTRK
jgi:hypothetical protein